MGSSGPCTLISAKHRLASGAAVGLSWSDTIRAMRMAEFGAYPLGVGEEAFCLLYEIVGTRSVSGDRKTLKGAARVRIDAITEAGYDVVIVAANGGVAGHRMTVPRGQLYATVGEENAAFGGLVRRFWSRND